MLDSNKIEKFDADLPAVIKQESDSSETNSWDIYNNPAWFNFTTTQKTNDVYI